MAERKRPARWTAAKDPDKDPDAARRPAALETEGSTTDPPAVTTRRSGGGLAAPAPAVTAAPAGLLRDLRTLIEDARARVAQQLTAGLVLLY